MFETFQLTKLTKTERSLWRPEPFHLENTPHLPGWAHTLCPPLVTSRLCPPHHTLGLLNGSGGPQRSGKDTRLPREWTWRTDTAESCSSLQVSLQQRCEPWGAVQRGQEGQCPPCSAHELQCLTVLTGSSRKNQRRRWLWPKMLNCLSFLLRQGVIGQAGLEFLFNFFVFFCFPRHSLSV